MHIIIICYVITLLHIHLPDTQTVPMMSEQVIEKLEEMTSEADTGYDTGSVVSASSLSQLNKVGITW